MGNIQGGFQENSFIFLMAIGILIMLALALAFVIFANYSQKKIMKGEMRHQELALKHQQELLHSNILTQEAERKRIAQELHDEIGSKLNVILLNIHQFRNQKRTKDEEDAIVQEMKSLINKTINTTRRISHDLLPPTLEEFGLVEAIKELRDSYQQLDIVDINFELVRTEGDLNDKLVELNLFRVIQELISNSLRHGKAKEIDILLRIESSLTKLEYRDNGLGFEQSDMENRKGLGMRNIESRLNMIHAQYNYESSPGNGVSMKIQFKT